MKHDLSGYFDLVIHQAHQSEDRRDGEFYCQAWLINQHRIAILAASPYLRVLHKVYYRLYANLPRNFNLEPVDVTRLVNTTKDIPIAGQHQVLPPVLYLSDLAQAGFTLGAIDVPVFNRQFYIGLNKTAILDSDSDSPDAALFSSLPPCLRESNPCAYADALQKFHYELSKADYLIYYYESKNADILARNACAAVTDFRPPKLDIQEVYTRLPESNRKFRLK